MSREEIKTLAVFRKKNALLRQEIDRLIEAKKIRGEIDQLAKENDELRRLRDAALPKITLSQQTQCSPIRHQTVTTSGLFSPYKTPITRKKAPVYLTPLPGTKKNAGYEKESTDSSKSTTRYTSPQQTQFSKNQVHLKPLSNTTPASQWNGVPIIFFKLPHVSSNGTVRSIPSVASQISMHSGGAAVEDFQNQFEENEVSAPAATL